MKPRNQHIGHRNRIQLLLFCLSCGILVLIMVGCLCGRGLVPIRTLQQSVADEKLSAIRKGDLRDSALKVMADAWHHGVCSRLSGRIYDVFLIGPKEVNRMYVVVVTSESQNGVYRVTGAAPAERYLLREYGFEECLPKWVLTSTSTPIPTK